MRTRSRSRFVNQPRSARRDRFVSLRWKIRQDSSGHGVFLPRYVMPGMKDWNAETCGSAEAPNGHTEVQFLSRLHAAQGWLYHASILSAPQALAERLEEQVDEQLEGLLAPYGGVLAGYPQFSFGSAPRPPDPSPWPRFAALGNKTMPQLELELWEAIDAQDWPEVHLSRSRSLDCPTGIDLRWVVATPDLTVQAVAALVDAFWEQGEEDGPSAPVEDWSPYLPMIIAAHDQLMAHKRHMALRSVGEA